MNQDLSIAFIGAGKVGVSLGKYLSINGIHLLGFYSKDIADAHDAAAFTDSQALDLTSLLKQAQLVFITVPDDQIESTAALIAKHANNNNLDLNDKIFCHCSGSLSSSNLNALVQEGAFTYSLHPMFAFANKHSVYKNLSQAHFTLEGEPKNIDKVKSLLEHCSNLVTIIDSKNKTQYHLASVMASNFVLALLNQSISHLTACGFSHEDARNALTPLIKNNIDSILDKGPSQSLTGPVERSDIKTVQKHLAILDTNEQQLYALLSRELVNIADARAYIDTDYSDLTSLLNEYIHIR